MTDGMKEAALTGADLNRFVTDGLPEVHACEDDVAMVSHIRESESAALSVLLSFYEITTEGTDVQDLIEDFDDLNNEELTERLFAIKQGTYVPKWLSYDEPMRKLLRREERLSVRLFGSAERLPDGKLVYCHDKQALVDPLHVRRGGADGLWGQDIVDDFAKLSPEQVRERLDELAWFEPLFEGDVSEPAPQSRSERDKVRFNLRQEAKIERNQRSFAQTNDAKPYPCKTSPALKLLNVIKSLFN